MVAAATSRLLASLILWIWTFAFVSGYQVLVTSEDEIRQTCSGMWGKPRIAVKKDPWIDVVFAPASRGLVALVVYEWADAKYLGVDTRDKQELNDWEDERVFVCTVAARTAGLCTEEQLGTFITTLPEGVELNTTSIFTTAVQLKPSNDVTPVRYQVPKTGYYCVGTVPVIQSDEAPKEGDDSQTTVFTAVIDYVNVFDGNLPASEYPKIPFYFGLTFVYIALGSYWGWMCYKNRGELLAIQHYVSGTIGFIIVELLSLWGYYSYLNSGGNLTFSRILLVLVAILNSARNSASLGLLLVVAMGYGIVRPSLGPAMLRVRILTGVHFVFGVLYSAGITLVPLEDAGLWLFFFVLPLAFTLTAFMLWIIWSLKATIADLEIRRQTYKKTMFTRLYRILLSAAIVVWGFFVVSSLTFSQRLADDFAPDTWKTRWILSDGWLSLLFLVVFASIAYLWRPTPHNRRLAMSDEIATDEEAAEEYEIGGLERHMRGGNKATDEDDDRREGMLRIGKEDGTVFELGASDDEDSDDDRTAGRRSGPGGRRGSPPPYEASGSGRMAAASRESISDERAKLV